MPDEIDWSLATFEGVRRRQHQEFRALSFHEKIKRIEQMEEVARQFAPNDTSRAASSEPEAAPSSDSDHDER